jgi:hypothetical protein
MNDHTAALQEVCKTGMHQAFAGMVSSRNELQSLIDDIDGTVKHLEGVLPRMRRRAAVSLALAAVAVFNINEPGAFIWGCTFALGLWSVTMDYLPFERHLKEGRKLAATMRADMKRIDADIEKARNELEAVQ